MPASRPPLPPVATLDEAENGAALIGGSVGGAVVPDFFFVDRAGLEDVDGDLPMS